MEALLPEMATEIAQYLTPKDLAACCQVSKTMRELFGSDEIWRPRCDDDCEEYLRTTPCRVIPKLASLESENSTLKPVGQWRSAYIREAHLWNNWRHGRYVEEVIGSSQRVVFLNNDFIITLSNNLLKLIDTTKNPAVCVAQLASGSAVLMSVIHNDKLITWDLKNTVQVITVDWESYTLSVQHSFCVTEGSRIEDYDIVNTLFVGCERDSLHIWDLQEATKLKLQACPSGIDIKDLEHDAKCENLGLSGYKDGSVCFYLYSLRDLQFYPFTRRFPGILSFAIVDHYVALITVDRYVDILDIRGNNNDCNIEIYNYHTSERLYVLEACSMNVYGVGNSFVYINSHYELVQLSAETGIVTCIDSNISCPFHLWYPRPRGCRLILKRLQYSNENLYEIPCTICSRVYKLWKITPKTAVSAATVLLNWVNRTINQVYSKAATSVDIDVLYTYW